MTLRIQKLDVTEFVVFTLSGRINADNVAELQKLLASEIKVRSVILDLQELQLVDQDAVAFLARCESDGTTLRNCPAYIREWIENERDGRKR